MVDSATPRRRSSGEIPMLLKGIVCGLISFLTYLFSTTDEISRGGRIGLTVAAVISGLFAVIWLLSWVHSLAVTVTGGDVDETLFDDRGANNAEHGVDAPFNLPAGMEIKYGDEEPEETPVDLPHEQVPPRQEPWFEVVLGWIFDILSGFPYFLVVVTVTPMLVYVVADTIAGWIGLAPARTSNLPRLVIMAVCILSIYFAWRWRSQLMEDGSRLRNVIILVSSAEIAAIGIGICLAAVGAVVLALGEIAGFW